jgi:hypothetical protein
MCSIDLVDLCGLTTSRHLLDYVFDAWHGNAASGFDGAQPSRAAGPHRVERVDASPVASIHARPNAIRDQAPFAPKESHHEKSGTIDRLAWYQTSPPRLANIGEAR